MPSSVDSKERDPGVEVVTPPDPVADDPVPVAGAFFVNLECAYRNVIIADQLLEPFSCRLHEANGQKWPLPAAGFAIELRAYNASGQPVNATFQPDTDAQSPWHWSGLISDLDAGGAKVQGLVTYQGKKYLTNMTPIQELRPTNGIFGFTRIYALGDDGTFNCAPGPRGANEIVDTPSAAVPNRFIAMDFVVPKGGSVVSIDLKSICEVGINSVMAFVRQTNLAVPERRTASVPLPENNPSNSWIANFSVMKSQELKEGTYQLVIQTAPGNSGLEDAYIDDIEIRGTRELAFPKPDAQGVADIPGIANDKPFAGNVVIVVQ